MVPEVFFVVYIVVVNVVVVCVAVVVVVDLVDETDSVDMVDWVDSHVEDYQSLSRARIREKTNVIKTIIFLMNGTA